MNRDELISDLKESYFDALLESYGIDLRKENEKKSDVLSKETSALLQNANSDEEVALAIEAAISDRVDYFKKHSKICRMDYELVSDPPMR